MSTDNSYILEKDKLWLLDKVMYQDFIVCNSISITLLDITSKNSSTNSRIICILLNSIRQSHQIKVQKKKKDI